MLLQGKLFYKNKNANMNVKDAIDYARCFLFLLSSTVSIASHMA